MSKGVIGSQTYEYQTVKALAHNLIIDYQNFLRIIVKPEFNNLG